MKFVNNDIKNAIAKKPKNTNCHFSLESMYIIIYDKFKEPQITRLLMRAGQSMKMPPNNTISANAAKIPAMILNVFEFAMLFSHLLLVIVCDNCNVLRRC